MAVLSDLPPELVHHIASFLTRETLLDPHQYLRDYKSREPELVPDLPSINALSRTNTVSHRTLNQALYNLCAGVEVLGKLALLFAVERELESTLDKLVLAGINLDIEFEIPVNGAMRPLHIAAFMGLRTMVIKLLRVGLPAHCADLYARTALDLSARQGHLEIVRILAPIRNDVPLVLSEPHGQYLGRALRESAIIGNLEISQYLVSEGADINFLRDPHHGFTLLSFAARTGNLGLVQLLLASGADPNLHSARGLIPLFAAANMDIVRALVAGGANVHITNSHSCNLAFIDNVEKLHFFLERGVDPNHVDDLAQTPLYGACLSKKGAENAKACVELLLQFGANTVEKLHRHGYTPVDCAMQHNYPEVVKILEPFVQDPDLKLLVDLETAGSFNKSVVQQPSGLRDAAQLSRGRENPRASCPGS